VAISTSPDVLAAHLSGEAVLLNLSDKSYYRLNETAALVWSGLERGESVNDILAALLSRYAVGADQALEEMNRVIDDMKSRNLLIDSANR
jgi:hypothetical protein